MSVFLKKKMKTSDNMALNDTEVKHKCRLSIEKNTIK